MLLGLGTERKHPPNGGLGGERHRSVSTRHKWAGSGDKAVSRTARVPALLGLVVPQEGETTNTSHMWRAVKEKPTV